MTMIRRLALAAAALLAAGAVSAQTIRTGSLLVATPALEDANFAESVVLVLRHDQGGTIGLVVNRVTSLAPAEVFPELAESLGGYDGRLFRGGPVAPTQLLLLVQGLGAAVVGGPAIVDNVYVTANPEELPELVALSEGDQGLRLYAGHAEWGAGQLAAEVQAGAWRVIDGSADLVFHPEPGRLWREALALGAGSGAVVDARP
ncbi:MAG TPA: YqgE/AlgH family protein [Gammaproteobacteria bacterium]